MTPFWERVLVTLVVAVAWGWALRGLKRTWRAGRGCSGCATGGDCPVADDPIVLQDLTTLKPPSSSRD